MKNKRGVTLTSLTIYVIVLVIVLVIFTFVSANYTSQIGQVVSRGKVSNEVLKIYSFLISDVKAAKEVLDYSEESLRLDNDVKYHIKYISNRATEKMQYEVYRNDVLIGENILDAKFDYDEDKNVLAINLKYMYGKVLVEKSQSFKVGR